MEGKARLSSCEVGQILVPVKRRQRRTLVLRCTCLIGCIGRDSAELRHAIGPSLQRRITCRIFGIANVGEVRFPARYVRIELGLAGIRIGAGGLFLKLFDSAAIRRTVDIVITLVEFAFVETRTDTLAWRRAARNGEKKSSGQ